MIILDHRKLETLLYRSLELQRVDRSVSESLVCSVIQTSLRGVDSHGINLFPHYFQQFKLNRLNGNPSVSKHNATDSVCIIDADNTLGHYAGDLAVEEAIRIAKTQGVSVVSVKHSTHFGAAAYFTNKIAEADMLGFAFTNTEALVNAFNSKEAFFGTNPFCFSAPMLEEDPFCLDMATSTVPWNKIKNYRRQNMELEDGWAYDKNGAPTTDPHAARSLSAIGGYKGYGLGMVIEILCSGLTHGPLSKDVIPMYDASVPDNRDISHLFMAIDVSKFLQVDLFKNYMHSMVKRLRSLPKSSKEPVYVAGDKEKTQFSKRSVKGIPVDESKFEEFLQISEDYREAIL